jgi:hypothetical protein
MTPDMIEKFVTNKTNKGKTVNIHFKDRQTVKGLFVKLPDYEELKSKNFWRIVNSQHFEKWNESNDISLSRLFNGASFTRLSDEN